MDASRCVSILLVATGLASAACTSDSSGSEPEVRDAGRYLDGSASADSGAVMTSPNDVTTNDESTDATDDGSLACIDAPNGRTDTDACVGNRQPCNTACDCCFYVEGASCTAGFCVQTHPQ